MREEASLFQLASLESVTGENAWDPKGDAVAAILDGGAQKAEVQRMARRRFPFHPFF